MTDAVEGHVGGMRSARTARHMRDKDKLRQHRSARSLALPDTLCSVCRRQKERILPGQ
jgi:hypothetical protein